MSDKKNVVQPLSKSALKKATIEAKTILDNASKMDTKHLTEKNALGKSCYHFVNETCNVPRIINYLTYTEMPCTTA